MDVLVHRPVGCGTARVVVTDRGDGDVHPRRVPPSVLVARQLAATGRRWSMLDQVHGVERVDLRGGRQASDIAAPQLLRGDVVVADAAGTAERAVAVWTADCAPVVLVGAEGTLVCAHGGWRGLAAGVLDVAAAALAERGESVAAAVVGPLVHPCCYEFGEAQLELVACGVGADPDRVSASTSWGAPAIDLPAVVVHGLARRGIEVDVMGPCTGCDDRWYSHRRRGDRGRHAVVAWIEAAEPIAMGVGGRHRAASGAARSDRVRP